MYYLKLKNIVEELNFRIGGINNLLQVAEREDDLPNAHRIALGKVWTDLEFLSSFLSSFALQKKGASFYDVESLFAFSNHIPSRLNIAAGDSSNSFLTVLL